jgi:hypothetical protein
MIHSEQAGPGANCAARPAEFLDWDEFAQRRPTPAESPVKNVVKLHRSGAIVWNGQELQSADGPFALVQKYFGVISQMDPQPLTFLDFEAGASCSSIERVRTLMSNQLQCGAGKTCFQGPGPG